MKPLVAYYRVSTREQGKSGLGLDAQRADVGRFVASEGFGASRSSPRLRRVMCASSNDRCLRIAAVPQAPGLRSAAVVVLLALWH